MVSVKGVTPEGEHEEREPARMRERTHAKQAAGLEEGQLCRDQLA